MEVFPPEELSTVDTLDTVDKAVFAEGLWLTRVDKGGRDKG